MSSHDKISPSRFSTQDRSNAPLDGWTVRDEQLLSSPSLVCVCHSSRHVLSYPKCFPRPLPLGVCKMTYSLMDPGTAFADFGRVTGKAEAIRLKFALMGFRLSTNRELARLLFTMCRYRLKELTGAIWSLVPQCHHGLYACGTPRRDHRCQQRSQDQHRRRKREHDRIPWLDAEQLIRH